VCGMSVCVCEGVDVCWGVGEGVDVCGHVWVGVGECVCIYWGGMCVCLDVCVMYVYMYA